jgi:hypothetical protein
VNEAVKNGRMPHPNSLPCADCGHVWSPAERRHEYDHYLGYSAKHQLDVEPVCTQCHVKRDSAKAKQTHCGQGHEFTAENTTIKVNGTRECRACRKVWDSNQHRGRDAAYWRAYRAERKARHG